MVEGVRATESMLLSRVDKDQIGHLTEMKHIFEKSVVSTCHISNGTRLTGEMIALKKPGGGISPGEIDVVVGAIAVTDIESDTLLRWDQVEVDSERPLE